MWPFRKPAYGASQFNLELDGKVSPGFVRTMEGGGVRSETLTERVGGSGSIWRQQGAPKYDDIKLQVGMAMSRTFYQWVDAFMRGTIERRDGALVATDFKTNERARRTFKQALLSEVTFPKFGPEEGQAAYLGVTLVPESTAYEASQPPGPSAPKIKLRRKITNGVRQKLWAPNRFRFEIEHLEDATTRTRSVDAFTIKQQIHEYRSGEFKDPTRVPGRIEIPSITFSVPEVDAAPLIARAERVLSKGTREDTRLTANLTALDEEKRELCSVSFYGVEIVSVQPDRNDATSKDLRYVKVELAVESMTFDYENLAVDG